jgi:hypothetical protein
MRRSRTVDWFLLATLLPVYAAIQVGGIRAYHEHEGWFFPFSVTGAQGADGYPFVDRVSVPDCPVRVGDRVLRIEATELRGMRRVDVNRAQIPLLPGGRPYRVDVERTGQRLALWVVPAAYPRWWLRVLGSVSLALAGTLLLVRAPHWHLSRRFFVSELLTGSWGTADVGSIFAAQLLLPAGLALGLLNAFQWTEAARCLRPWQRALPWALAPIRHSFA